MKQELDVYIRARYPLLWVVTPEEKRALAEIEALALDQKKRLLIWSATTGVTNPAVPDRVDANKRDPLALLGTILEDTDACIWVLRDFHPYLKEPTIIRRLREVAFGLQSQKVNKTVVLLGPVFKIPPELEKEITVLDFNLPTEAQLLVMLERLIEDARRGSIKVALDRRQRTRLVKACLGLTEVEAANAVAKAIILAAGRLDGDAIDAVTAEKQQIIRKSGLLEFYASAEQLATVGGLATLKEWLRKRERAFDEKARAFGLPEPKGILLVGVQGCGKSLVAKAVANAWRLPLLRLDVGRLFASLVGSSEENLRNAIKVAESIAPVVLWVDEIEKGFSGVGSSNVSDAGTAARVFGSFITWLQEKQAPVFVIACVTPDTAIVYGDGTIACAGAQLDLPVLTKNFTRGTLDSIQPERRLQMRAKQITALQTRTAALQCTPNHPFFVLRDDGIHLVQAGKLQVGDYVARPVVLPEPPRYENQLIAPDTLDVRAKSLRYPDCVTPDLAQLLGYSVGDGGFCNPKQYRWTDTNRSMLQYYQQIIENLFGVCPTITRDARREAGWFMYLNSTGFCKFLRHNFPELTQGSRTACVPVRISRADNQLVAAFLRGYMDAEGSAVVKSRHIFVGTTSKQLAQEIQLLFMRLKLHLIWHPVDLTNSTSFSRGIFYRLLLSENRQAHRYAEIIGFSHPEKQEKLQKILSRVTAQRGRTLFSMPVAWQLIETLRQLTGIPANRLRYYKERRWSRQQVDCDIFSSWVKQLQEATAKLIPADRLRANDLLAHLLRITEFFWDEVQAVATEPYDGFVYDFCVPEHHNYIANGFVTHNTANDVSHLPPELVRKGRFDEIFFVDLPDLQERIDIWSIHLQKRSRGADQFDLPTLAMASDGLSGAEIEQAIIAGLYEAFDQNRPLNMEDLLTVLQETVPLSRMMEEEIEALRLWARQRARRASAIVTPN